MGTPYALKYNGTLYYYVTNLQGDILHIVDASGAAVVSYTYSPYGKPLSTTGTLASTLGVDNPLRYRGYYYDTDSGLYYLQSRYYDPELCRFLNADSPGYLGADGSLLSYNLFAYCENNPVIFQDSSGNSAILATLGIMAIGGVIGAVVSAVSSAITQKALTGSVNWKSVGVSAATGFVSGAVAASPLGIEGQIAVGGAIGGLSYAADCYVNNKPINTGEVLLSTVTGMASGAIGGPGANEGMVLTDAIEYMGQTAAREARRANQAYAAKAVANATYYGSNIISASAWEASFRFSAGCGVSNGVNVKINEMGLFSDFPTWNPW